MSGYHPLTTSDEVADAQLDENEYNTQIEESHEYDDVNPFSSAAAINSLISGSIHNDNKRRLSGTSSFEIEAGSSSSREGLSRMATSTLTPPTGKDNDTNDGSSSSTSKDGTNSSGIARFPRAVCLPFYNFVARISGIEADDTPADARTKLVKVVAELIVALSFFYGFQLLIHNQFCAFLFKCSCSWAWAGAWDSCEAQTAAAAATTTISKMPSSKFKGKGPKGKASSPAATQTPVPNEPACPWCTSHREVPWTAGSLLFGLMVITFLLALHWRARPSTQLDAASNVALRWAAPVLAYFVVGALVGWLLRATSAYPALVF